MSEELVRMREQSREALEMTWARVEKLQDEVDETNDRLAQLQEKLTSLRTMKSIFSMGGRSVLSANSDVSAGMAATNEASANQQDDPAASDADEVISACDDGSNKSPGAHEGSNNSRSGNSKSNGDDQSLADVRIKLMQQEREERINELEAELEEKGSMLGELQELTLEQQETIHTLHSKLDEIQAPHRKEALEEQVRGLKSLREKLSNELEEIHGSMTEMENDHLRLSEEWHDREDRIADVEANASGRLRTLQKKLQKCNEEVKATTSKRVLMDQTSQESLESLRQDLMDNLQPDDCQSLMRELKTTFDELRKKEDQLARVVADRLFDRRMVSTSEKKLQTISRDFSGVLKSLLTLSSGIGELTVVVGDAPKVVELCVEIKREVSSSVVDIANALTRCMQTRRGFLMDHIQDGLIDPMQSPEELTPRIQSALAEILRDIPHTTFEAPQEEKRPTVEMIKSSILEKETLLVSVRELISQVEAKANRRFERGTIKAKAFDGHNQFLQDGIREKDRLIKTVKGVLASRRKKESRLKKEISLLRKHRSKPRMKEEKKEEAKEEKEQQNEQEEIDGTQATSSSNKNNSSG